MANVKRGFSFLATSLSLELIFKTASFSSPSLELCELIPQVSYWIWSLSNNSSIYGFYFHWNEMELCLHDILVEGKKWRHHPSDTGKEQGRPDSCSQRNTDFSGGSGLFCGRKIRVLYVLYKSLHSRNEKFNSIIKIQKKYKFGRISWNYWKKNYYLSSECNWQEMFFWLCVCFKNISVLRVSVDTDYPSYVLLLVFLVSQQLFS